MRIPAHIVRDGTWWRNTIDGSSMALIESPYGRFLIDRMAVSNGRFRRFIDTAGEREDRDDPLVLGEEGFPEDYFSAAEWADYPTMLVSYGLALRYAAWSGGALPTIAEWRFAAYGREPRRYPWGDSWGSGPAQSAERASVKPLDTMERELWFSHPEYFQTTIPPTARVDSFPEGASPFGLLCCIGNVQEWCAADDSDALHDVPVLGGCYTWFAEDLVYDRVLVRASGDLPAQTIGFRCVIRLESSDVEGPAGSA
jgi:formylglycine-generating enzyme required for sulfatase activity